MNVIRVDLGRKEKPGQGFPVADQKDRSLWDENGSRGSKAKIYTALSRKVAGKNVHATIPKGYKDMSNTLLLTL